MYELEKIYTFEAGHVMTHHDGKCSRPHGHSYILKVRLRCKELIPSGPKTNMVMDFYDLNQIVRPMIEEFFDHRWLNETLNSSSPSVEFIAKWIYDYLKPRLPLLYSIALNETASALVTYREES